MPWRRGFAGGMSAVALTALAAGCGGDDPASGGAAPHRSGTASATVAGRPSASGAATVADRLAYFSSSVRTTAGVREVLRDPADVKRFADKVAADDPGTAEGIVAAGRGTDFSQRVMVGWTATTGCSAATTATLTVSGHRLQVRVSQPEPPPECLVAFRMTAVFDVPRERIPAQPELG